VYLKKYKGYFHSAVLVTAFLTNKYVL